VGVCEPEAAITGVVLGRRHKLGPGYGNAGPLFLNRINQMMSSYFTGYPQIYILTLLSDIRLKQTGINNSGTQILLTKLPE
jgi:hypothetical protein